MASSSSSSSNNGDARAPECTDEDIEQGGGFPLSPYYNPPTTSVSVVVPAGTGINEHRNTNNNNDRDDGPPLPLPLQNLDLESNRDITLASATVAAVIYASPTAASASDDTDTEEDKSPPMIDLEEICKDDEDAPVPLVEEMGIDDSAEGKVDTEEDKSPPMIDLEEISTGDEDAPVPLVQLVAEMGIEDSVEGKVDTKEDESPPTINLEEISTDDENAPVTLVQLVAEMGIDVSAEEISSRDVLSKASANAGSRYNAASQQAGEQPPQAEDEENTQQQQSEDEDTHQRRNQVSSAAAAEERELSSLPLIPCAFLVEEPSDDGYVYDAIAVPLEPEVPWWKPVRTKVFVALTCAVIAALAISLGVTLSRPSPAAAVALTADPPSPAIISLSPSPSQSPTAVLVRPTEEPVSAAPYATTSCEPYRGTVNLGYYESWAVYRYGDSGSCNPLQPNAIKVADLGYTHLSFSFAGISSLGLIEPYDGESADFIPMYKSFNSLKVSNPGLKTLISVGGWTFDQTRFSFAASTPTTRSKFAQSVVSFLTDYDFDGIDLDWEHPVTRQGTPEDYENYPLLCQALREAFDDAGHPEWYVTIQIPVAWNDRLVPGYDLVGMTPYVDWFNLMAYDIFGAWNTFAGANTDMRYIKDAVANIFALRIPREKLVLGLAAYGRSATLVDPACYTDGCEINGAGLTGCHGEAGNLPYFEIMEKYVNTGNYDSLYQNPTTMSMELVTGGYKHFTSFDNGATLKMKTDFAYDQCMSGVFWWAADLVKTPIDINISTT